MEWPPVAAPHICVCGGEKNCIVIIDPVMTPVMIIVYGEVIIGNCVLWLYCLCLTSIVEGQEGRPPTCGPMTDGIIDTAEASRRHSVYIVISYWLLCRIGTYCIQPQPWGKQLKIFHIEEVTLWPHLLLTPIWWLAPHWTIVVNRELFNQYCTHWSGEPVLPHMWGLIDLAGRKNLVIEDDLAQYCVQLVVW